MIFLHDQLGSFGQCDTLEIIRLVSLAEENGVSRSRSLGETLVFNGIRGNLSLSGLFTANLSELGAGFVGEADLLRSMRFHPSFVGGIVGDRVLVSGVI